MVETTGGYTELEKELSGSESKHALRSLAMSLNSIIVIFFGGL